MTSKLDRTDWRRAVASHRRTRHNQSFAESVRKQKRARSEPQGGKEWIKRVQESRSKTHGGGRSRTLPGPAQAGKRTRKVGGMLRSNTPRSRPTMTEKQRQALPKTGNQAPKKGINASSWSYDHRKATSARRNEAAKVRSEQGKKGINASRWHYDHQKAMASAKAKSGTMSKANTHVPSYRRREAVLGNTSKSRPQQPRQPTPPKAKQPTKAPAPRRTK